MPELNKFLHRCLGKDYTTVMQWLEYFCEFHGLHISEDREGLQESCHVVNSCGEALATVVSENNSFKYLTA